MDIGALKQTDYRKMLDNVYGPIMVTNNDKKVLFVNKMTVDFFKTSYEDFVGADLDYLIERGVFVNSASRVALDTKKLTVRYVRGKTDVPIMTIAHPVLDVKGELDMVVAISIDERFLEDIVEKMIVEKNNILQLLTYFSDNDSKNLPMVAESDVMKKIIKCLTRFSAVDSTVLLTGESGTGKEVLSRYLHKNSKRSSGVFVPVNCAAIPEELMESEFFGYERGAFTGANKDGKAGFFELADKGTLFLDEIAEMPLPIQAKFLRVLETGEIRRLGSEKTKHVDVRIVAATNKNLYKMVKSGDFREDLYYRLNVLPIRLPPLRERPEDILPLGEMFLEYFNKKYGFIKIFSRQFKDKMMSYSWPGNIRELRNVVERVVIASDSNILYFEPDIKKPFKRSKNEEVPKEKALEPDGRALKDQVRDYEEKLINSTLNLCGGNVVKAAEILKLHKSVLYRKIEGFKNPEK